MKLRSRDKIPTVSGRPLARGRGLKQVIHKSNGEKT